MMEDELSNDEAEELKRIRSGSKKRGLNDLNRRDLTSEELDDIFCEI